MSDRELIARYASEKDQGAFAELVRRHLGWAYSYARRLVRDQSLAEDVVQAAFTLLSRKAGALSSRSHVAGWLFRTTQYCAREAMRREAMRQKREREAAMQRQSAASAGEVDWEQVWPILDEAVGRLRRKDRDAVLLRFYQGMTMAELAAAEGIGEEAAKKRVQRAVEKLRGMLGKQGVTATSAGLSAVLVGNVVQDTSQALVDGVMKAVGGGANAVAWGIAKGAMKTMSLTKLTAVAGTAMLLLTAAILPIALAQVSSSSSGSVGAKAPTAPASTQASALQVDIGGWTAETHLVDIKLRVVGQAAQRYMLSHNSILPANLGETLALMDQRTSLSSRAKTFLTPRDEQRIRVPDAVTADWVNQNTSYVYLAGNGNVDVNKIPNASETILIHTKLDEPFLHPKRGKVVVAVYVDGHGELLDLEQAVRAIEESKKTLAAARMEQGK